MNHCLLWYCPNLWFFVTAVLFGQILAKVVLIRVDIVVRFPLEYESNGVCLKEAVECLLHRLLLSVHLSLSGEVVVVLDLQSGVLCCGDPTYPMICPVVFGSMLMSTSGLISWNGPGSIPCLAEFSSIGITTHPAIGPILCGSVCLPWVWRGFLVLVPGPVTML